MNKFKVGFVAIGAAALLVACGETADVPANVSADASSALEREPASIEAPTAFVTSSDGKTYKSTLFDLTLQKPDEWVSANKAEADKLMNIGTEVIASGDKQFQGQLDQGMQRSLTMFMMSRYPMSPPRPDNPSISAVAENVLIAPQVQTGADYFDQMKLLIVGQNVPMTFADDYGAYQIDGQRFDTMEATFDVPGLDLSQTYYAARRGDHVIALITTTTTELDRVETMALLDSIELDWD